MKLQSPIQPQLSNKPGNKSLWGQLYGSAQALALLSAARQHESLTLVITADTHTASRLENELFFFNSYEDSFPVLHFPDWEILPYDTFSPHQDIISERLQALYKLPTTRRGILVVSVATILHRLAPPNYLARNSLIVNCGQSFDIELMRRQLESAGYRCVDTVYEHGEYAVRGSLMDIYPMGSRQPYRIDLFDDEVESLRTFDTETQRTIDKVEQIRLLPAKEYPLDKSGIRYFKDRWHEEFNVDHRECPIYQDVNAGIAPPGIEYYLPLFFQNCSSLFEYLPPNSQTFILGNIDEAAERFWKELSQRYESRRVDPLRPLLSPSKVFLTVDEMFSALKNTSQTRLQSAPLPEAIGSVNFHTDQPPALTINAKAENPLQALENFLLETRKRVLICAESPGRRESILELLRRIEITPQVCSTWQDFIHNDQPVAITVAPLDRGLILDEPDIALIAESQLFGEQVQQKRRRKKAQDSSDQIIKNLTELRVGAPVVHIEHGVGRYLGLQTIDVEGEPNEFLMLEYADNAKLYVPVASLHLISRYSGADPELAPIHRLGSEQWQKAKRKAAEQIKDTAAELLDIYARRAARKGFSFNDPEDSYHRFASGFPFEETPDQQDAIDAVFKDMISPQPMDRLVCGDVGFGKTEVAMRAAFIAVHAGKQVAMLVPTTLLAQQHYENFKDRFADWPVNIEVLSRFRSSKDSSAVQKQLAAGGVDIIIGTHKLLQSDLNYKALGLLIIDEEHRFGVQQKERLKSLRSEVDILTLTATPIPRTLNMAMSGVRELSIIATPPARRLSVKTFVRQTDDAIIKEAILREILRGGQVYYLHNEVKTIEKTAQELQTLIPEARIGIGHGQLRERELEQVMSDFYHKRFNILVCTTIIETGIDVPSANTILIHRADKFGLAQLHQLRGRVGRSHHQAYAYLLTPDKRNMTGDAVKRLDAIAGADDLGAGFTLATHDLEIRGAGELLGEEQSGQMQAVGFSLYMEMLDRAVKAIKSGKTPNIEQPLDSNLEVNVRIPALIPDDYLPDVHTRLILYKRIANADSHDELKELQIEMIDRFGLLPPATKNLLRVTELKLKAQKLGIEKLEASAMGGRIEFSGETKVDPLTIVKLVQTQPQIFKLDGASQLKFTLAMDDSESRLSTLSKLLEQLTPKELAA